MYVLDTNVISELRKGKKAERSVRMWAQALPTASLFLSVVSVLELEIEILLVERRDRNQGAILRAWIDGHVLPSFFGRILAIDTAVAQRCASLHVPTPRSDRDALIAATAFVRGLTVATRNVADFGSPRKAEGVRCRWKLTDCDCGPPRRHSWACSFSGSR